MIVKIQHHKIKSGNFEIVYFNYYPKIPNKFNFHKSYFRSSAQTRDIFNLMPMPVVYNQEFNFNMVSIVPKCILYLSQRFYNTPKTIDFFNEINNGLNIN
ncbi:unnamed protein product [Rhizophagus irregularis]|uniref:Uncharacterized protein n=1 Tax=Rhizophagus irregularis TaxID=588596 RepID=A0A915Z0C1_9GLOM|nr:unnamed protein product [Rhizophagus irregularis]CAB5356466.1 unnamed protein product [Rhizophagus irregularis]